jgi:serine/threonine protein kinase
LTSGPTGLIFDLVSKIGRYEVESEIGRGAMGVVYLARDPRLERRVAVKIFALPQGLSGSETGEFRERFLREARAAAALSHRGIVTIYDADEDGERQLPFIAMEYVPGRTLRRTLEAEGPFEPDRVLAIAGMLTEALQVAHRAGIVHRDIKPANILMGPGGEAKIADFGVARISSSTLTRSGESVGSPAYMSPEQVRGGTIDGRSDLFSLAVILYELLCGARPFEGEDTSALLYAIAHGTPKPITKRVPGLPAGLDRFFERALARNPANRYPDGDALREALEAACVGPVTEDPDATMHLTPPARRRPRRRRALLVAGLAVLLLGAWFLFGVNRTAYLKLDGRSAMTSGELTLLIDGEEVYRRQLAAPHDRQGFLRKVLDKNVETFETLVRVQPGTHEVVAVVAGSAELPGYQESILVDLERGQTRTLRLSAGRTFGRALSLKTD